MVDDMNDLNVALDADDRAFVFAVVRRILATADAANDATQDALLVAHRFRDRFRGESSYRTWLYRIAVNAALGSVRKRRRVREEVADVELPDQIDPAESPEACVANRELVEQLAAEVADLEPIYRDVITLRVQDAGEDEIAETLGITVANAKVRVHRARQRLRCALADHVTPRTRAVSPAPRGSRADSTATRRAS